MTKRIEQRLQQACVKWFRIQHPELILFAVNNNTDVKNAAKGSLNKKLGVTAGASDLVFCFKGVSHFIELKTETGRQNPNQKKFQQRIESAGFRYYIVRSFEQFHSLITNTINHEENDDNVQAI